MFTEGNQKKIVQTLGLIGVAGAVLMLTQTFSTLKEMRYIGRGNVVPPTISVSGEGKIYTTPDVAIFNITISKDAKTQSEASTEVNGIQSKILDAVKGAGVSEKDIKTLGRTLDPKYEWQQTLCTREGTICPPGKNVQVGFTVSQTIEVKIRKIEDAGKIVDLATAAGATSVGSLQFTVDEPKAKQAEARELAIADAKAKAEKLADDLGVRLTRIASFNENSYQAPRAMYMKVEAMDMAGAAPTAQLPAGQNEIDSNVTITYEIQ